MSSETMLEKLDRYYKEQGIPALGFDCKHRPACSDVCAPGQMVSVPESYVGAEFEAGTLPRLLFLSSDTNKPEGLDEHPEYGTLQKIREIMWRDRNERWHQKPQGHWHQTVNMTRALLEPYAKARLEKVIVLNDFIAHFAHVRSTRCKDSGIGTYEGKAKMSLNCKKYLKQEIEIMAPDIIVVQGKRAENAIWDSFTVIRQAPMLSYPCTFYQIVQLSPNHTAIKIIAKHPCARGRNGWKSGEKKQFMDWAAKIVHEFLPVA